MRQSSYTDVAGRRWAVLLPDGVPDSDARLGLHLGPPPLDALNLPQETEVRLHNQLFARSIFSFNDAKHRRDELFAAIQAAYAVDSDRLIELLYTHSVNGHNPPKEG